MPFVLEGMIWRNRRGIACGLVYGGAHYIGRLALQIMPWWSSFRVESTRRSSSVDSWRSGAFLSHGEHDFDPKVS